MRLICGRPSGFSRKARVVVHELGLGDSVSVEFLAPQADKDRLTAIAPLGKVPVLVTPDQVIVDSPVICAYLCEYAGDRCLIPEKGSARWQTLCREAMADGILEAGMLARAEMARSDKGGASAVADWQLDKVRRGLLHLDRSERFSAHRDGLDLGDVALGCALGWLEFRLAELDLLKSYPCLRDRLAEWQSRPSFASTAPHI